MSHIVESVRRHQKMIVLGAALAIITIYVIPIDQIYASQTTDSIHKRFQSIRDRINNHDPPIPNAYKITQHLTEVEYRITQHLVSKGL